MNWACAWCFANNGPEPKHRVPMTWHGREGTFFFCSPACAQKSLMNERERDGGVERGEDRRRGR